MPSKCVSELILVCRCAIDLMGLVFIVGGTVQDLVQPG